MSKHQIQPECAHMTSVSVRVSVSVQYNNGFLPDITVPRLRYCLYRTCPLVDSTHIIAPTCINYWYVINSCQKKTAIIFIRMKTLCPSSSIFT